MTWPMVKIKNVASVITGKTPPKSSADNFDGDIPFITPAELGSDIYVSNSPQTLSAKGANIVKTVPKDAVMVCCIGSLGKLGIAAREVRTNQQINSVIFNKNYVFPKYGYYALAQLKPMLESIAPATTVAIVNKSNFESLEIPLPPFEEQKRIAAILDKADAIRQKRQQAITLADDFLRSVFLDMFGDPVTNPKGWELSTIGKLGNVITGSTPSSKKTGMFDGDIPFVTPGDLETDAPVSRTLTDEGALNCRTCRKGTTLVCCIGTIGKIGIASRTSAFNQQINAIEWGGEIDDEFGFFAMKLMKNKVISSAIKTTLPILNKSAFAALTMYLPPKNLQVEFSKIYSSTYRLNEKSKKFTINSNILFDSLLQKSFSGQL
ncbi:restriction endonuclease subunit S [Aeromonas veronii]|nr:restriction endonuclease subunit S [Aeromonas veronii]